MKTGDNSMIDTEDRSWWYKYGEIGEKYFVEWVCPDLDIDCVINPMKEKDPTVPDLIANGRLADLKTQKTPFFTAGRYSKTVDGEQIAYDPTYTVTFNVKDANRYFKHYRDIDIYFWVKWKETMYAPPGMSPVNVLPISGVWVVPFMDLREIINTHNYYVHSYMRRQGKTGNATESYLVDLRDLKELSWKQIE